MNPYLGEIRIFAGSFAPAGWQLCNGQLLGISQFNALYALLGTLYGGDGVQTFGLPDLRGRAHVSFGGAPGLTTYPMGAKGGVDTVTLTSSQLASHTHALAANTTAATAAGPAGNVPALVNAAFYTPSNAAGIVTENLAAASVGMAGGNGSHDNSMPSLALNFIIAVQGIYPSAN